MARTPLAHAVQSAVSVVAEAADRGVHPEKVFEERTTRRELLKRGGTVGVGLVAASGAGRLARAANAAVQPRIAIVRAGLAGLTCAYRLQQAGYIAQVYEASDRIGGRCWTIRD